ncbi:hypothetical protein POM88_012602 [Heracleum sosnowskyi]|uniref:Transposase-associated domain-containing protein n=1 Tax=Heracleum sosnowskyi TaxID=360622 RepID=A0AAD8IXP9_9APIA|nr:hypothetical protein POM88_012602 [Heracleum sosnowskyi]
MENRGDKWLEVPKYTDEYSNGVKDFLRNAFSKYAIGSEIRCPCKNCKNNKWHGESVIFDHLICDGPCPMCVSYIYEVAHTTFSTKMDHDMGMGGLEDNFDDMFHGTYRNLENCDEGLSKGPNTDVKNLYRLFEDGKQPLYPGNSSDGDDHATLVTEASAMVGTSGTKESS